ncbi:MAG: type II secretion system F family protein [Myxococcales bacterium]|nr:type II secretion system F family protein [Myxococcales bacterium]
MLALVIMTVISHGIHRYEKHYVERGASDLTEMFYFIDGRQLLLMAGASGLILGLMSYALFNWFVGAAMALIGIFTPHFGIRVLRQRRIRKFERQLVDALNQMSAAFRAGLTLNQAAESVASEMPAPLSQEFGLFIKEAKLGVPQEEALQNMAERVGSEDLQLVVTATNISKQLGGNMAEMFDIISTTIRERFRLEGRIRALTAQGKLQGWIVGLMPLALGLILNYMRPDLMQPMLHSKFGYALIATILVMEVIGMVMIRRIVAIDV